MSLSFDSRDLPSRDRIVIWREVLSRTIARIDWAPDESEPFCCYGKRCGLPGLGVMAMTISTGVYSRSRAMTADGNDDFLLSIPITGRRRISHCGREALLEGGDAMLLTAAEPASSALPSTAHGLSIAIPSRALAPMIDDRDATVARPIPRGTPALQLLTGYVDLLLQGHPLGAPDLQRRAVSHVYDLVALAVGATRDAAEAAKAAKGGGLRAARLHAIKADIAKNLDSGELSVTAVAARHQVTPRYVQMLFEDEGVTFTEYVLRQRLARAYRMLTDRRSAGCKISAVALDCGFGDLSYFNRCFRREFGGSPSEVRAQAAQAQWHAHPPSCGGGREAAVRSAAQAPSPRERTKM